MPQTDPLTATRSWPGKAVAFVLGDFCLGFLAILAAALTLVPMLFEVAPATGHLLEVGQWAVIGLFALEYGLGFQAAPQKRAFVLNPWRLLDLTTIAIPLATLAPGVSDLLRSSPVLRLVRLVRVVALGFRASGIVVRQETQRAAVQVKTPVQVSLLLGSPNTPPRKATWEEFLRWVKTPGEQWYHIANPGAHDLAEVAAAAGLSRAFIEAHLFGASYPHLDVAERCLSLFVWWPEATPDKPLERIGVLLLATDKCVFTLSQQPAPLLETAWSSVISPSPEGPPFPLRMLRGLLRAVLKRNEELVVGFERQLQALEEIPVRESRPEFFEVTFRLKKDLSAVQADLWRLKGLLTAVAESRLKLPEAGPEELPAMQALAEDANYLYETVSNLREGLLSLIELHLNIVSFEMNRVMRVLAVVSVLGLIPAVIGGLFGMNLMGNPWPFTLPQVTFAVVLTMILCLYTFLVKGWLR